MTVADGICTSAMLSKLALMVSAGRYWLTSMSRPMSVRTAATYSARFRRWNERRPGLRLSAALRSSVVSSAVASASRAGASSFFEAPRGGIIPVRSLRTTFSATSACASAFATSKLASDRPPDFERSLWQPTQ